jgi:hypothetical protein
MAFIHVCDFDLIARPDLGERWPYRLVATTAEDRLNPLIDLIDVVVDHHSHDG